MLLQCPASFRDCPEHVANLRSFCRNLDRGSFQAPLWGEPLYLRLHGGPGYRHRYTAEELSRLKALVAGRPAYVLFNNLDRFDDARSFARLLEQEP